MTGRKIIKPLQDPARPRNPVAANLADPAFRPQKTKSPKLYNRKVKHKNKPN